LLSFLQKQVGIDVKKATAEDATEVAEVEEVDEEEQLTEEVRVMAHANTGSHKVS
jgi:hypothetical protein